VSFRVDAYPTDNFLGTVTQIRLQPVVVSNVTTYGAVITVPNRELKLKPGMTANVKIEIAKRTNALRIPNAALRFRPTEEMFVALNQAPPPDLNAIGGGAGRGGRGGFGRGAAPGMGNQSATAPAVPAAPGSAAATIAPRAPRDANAVAGGREGGGRGRDGGGAGGGGGFGPGGGGRSGPEFQPRMLERFKTMGPDEQQQFLARMKERGGDTSAFEAVRAPSAAKQPGKTATAPTATTIDALFAPLPIVESRGRAWLFVDRQLKPVALRLGISDGTYTEVLSQEMADTTEVVTGVTGLTTSTRTLPAQNNGNPLMPGRGPGGPGRGGRG
jgi:HlyD family secretion protein